MRFLFCIFYVLNLLGLKAQDLPVESKKFLDEFIVNNDVQMNLAEFSKYDFSRVWLQSQDAVVGFIGSDYQRFRILFVSIVKNKCVENEYFVYGKSRVRGNICTFQGRLIITHVFKVNPNTEDLLLKEALKNGDMEVVNRLGKEKGYVLAKYSLYEDPKQVGAGCFKGVVKSNYYVDGEELHFDNLELGSSDSFSNNLFVGVWQSYKTNLMKACNWGSFRIPNCGDLDVGIGEFYPNSKYKDHGWDDYFESEGSSDRDDRYIDNNKWWE